MKQDWPSTVAKIIREAGIHPHDLNLKLLKATLLNNTEMVKMTIDSIKRIRN